MPGKNLEGDSHFKGRFKNLTDGIYILLLVLDTSRKLFWIPISDFSNKDTKIVPNVALGKLWQMRRVGSVCDMQMGMHEVTDIVSKRSIARLYGRQITDRQKSGEGQRLVKTRQSSPNSDRDRVDRKPKHSSS